MTVRKHWLWKSVGVEWWFLLALAPLIRPEPIASFIHDLLIAVLLLAVIVAVIVRRRIGNRALSTVAYVSLLPVMALALFHAGRKWGTLLLVIWSVVFAWYLFRNRPLVRPARGPVVWLALVSITWAFLFLLGADLFFGGPATAAWTAVDRLVGFLMVIGALAAIVAGGLVWWNRRDEPASISVVAVVVLLLVLVSEGRHDVRLWRGARELDRLEQRGEFAQARRLLNELWGLSRAKGHRFVHPDLTLASARLDIRDERPDTAVSCLVWVAEHAPKRQPEVCRLLDDALLNQLLQMPEEISDQFALFSDLEYAPDGGLYLLDRWGRVFRTRPGSTIMHFVHQEPLPVGRVAVDMEPVGEPGGFLILDHSGRIHLRGSVPSIYRDLVTRDVRHLPEAVDLEISPGGEGFYVVNAYGALAAYGRTAFTSRDNPHRWNYSIIRDLEVCPDETGLVLLDGYGSLHAIGEVPFDPKQPGAPYWFDILAEDIEFWPSGNGMYLMNCRGEWARFGDAPLDPNSHSFPHIGGVDFEISPSGENLVLLRSGGVLKSFRFGQPRIEGLLAGLRAARETRDLRAMWETAREIAELDPESAPALRSLFDAEYYETLLEVAVPEEEPLPVVRKLARTRGVSYILDAWGQILVREGDQLRLLSDVPLLPPGHFAVDFAWVGDPPLPIILTDHGHLCYSDRLPGRLQHLLEQCPEGIRQPVGLEVVEEAEQGYVLDAFGEIHPFGASPVGTPAEWQARWEEPMAVDFALVSGGRGILILDRHGGLHRVGPVQIDTRVAGAPWWGSPIACALTVDQAGESIAVLNIFGDIVPLGEWQQSFHRGVSPVEEGPYAVDFEFCADDGSFRVLAWTGQERVVPIGERTAEQLADQGIDAFQRGDLRSAVYKMMQAAHAAPERATEILAPFDASLMEAVAAGPYYTARAPDLVSDALPGDEPGSLLVLDRFGRVWRWEGGKYRLHLASTIPLDPLGERRAIAFRRRGDGFAVIDNLGSLTFCRSGESSRLLDEVEFPNPEQYAVDFAVWREGFLILDSLGGISPVGLGATGLPAVPEVSWGFPIARRLHLLGDRVYILDGLGGIHAPPGESDEKLRGAVYFPTDLVRDFEPDSEGTGFFIMDCAGRLSQTQRVRPLPNDALVPPEVVSLSNIITDFEKVQRRIWRERDLGEREFVKRDYVEYDSAIDLVRDPRDGALYVLYRTGRVSPIWTQKADARRYVDLSEIRRAQGDFSASIAELTRALVLDRDTALLESLDERSFSALSRLEEPFLRFFRDLEPAEENGEAFVLDRWGRIWRWSYGPRWTPLHSRPLPQGEGGKGEAVAFERVGTDGFLILTRAGELVLRGPVPPGVQALVEKWGRFLRDAVDLAITPAGDLAVIATAHGEIWRITAAGADPWPGDPLYWKDEVVRAVALRADGTGCVVYDFFGGMHPRGDINPATWRASPYVNLPVMADLWMTEDGEQAAFLRMDGSLFLTEGLQPPPWHRFLPLGLRRVRPSIPHVWEAVSNEISPAVDLELTPDLGVLFVLRGNGDVIRVWKGEEGAADEIAPALEASKAGDLSAAVALLDRAVFLNPHVLLSETFSTTNLAARVFDSKVGAASPVPLFVDVGIVHDSRLLLDRWGGLHRTDGEKLETIRESGRSSLSGACAVGMAGVLEGAWIGYENGEVEAWALGENRAALSFSVQWPAEWLVDIVADPGGRDLLGCTSTGKIVRLDPSGGSEQVVHPPKWGLPLAVTYLPESAGDGYLLDRLGTVHRAGFASIFTRFVGGHAAPYWSQGWARDLSFTPGGTGLLLLDAFGGVHSLGSGVAEVRVEGLPYFDVPIAVRLLVHDERILLLDGRGRTYLSTPLPPGI